MGGEGDREQINHGFFNSRITRIEKVVVGGIAARIGVVIRCRQNRKTTPLNYTGCDTHTDAVWRIDSFVISYFFRNFVRV